VDALAGEQQREVEIVLDERLGSEPLRLGAGGGVLRVAAEHENEAAGRERRHQQDCDAGE
jgi:hypothetical protein